MDRKISHGRMSYFFFVVFFAFFAGAFLVAIVLFTPFHHMVDSFLRAEKAGMPAALNMNCPDATSPVIR